MIPIDILDTGEIIINFSDLDFGHTPTLQNHVYKLSAQVARLATLCIEFSIKLPTVWYITTLVPQGVQRNIFLHGSSKGLN